MKLSRDKQNRPWMVGLGASSLTSLLIGLGIGVDASHGGLSSSNTAAPEPTPAPTARGLPNFVALAKRLKPEVVNISTTQTAQQTGRAEFFRPARSIWRCFPSRTTEAEEPRLRLHHRARRFDLNQLPCSG